jgi:hypothetical protein
MVEQLIEEFLLMPVSLKLWPLKARVATIFMAQASGLFLSGTGSHLVRLVRTLFSPDFTERAQLPGRCIKARITIYN